MTVLIALNFNGKRVELGLAHNTVRALRAIEELAKNEAKMLREEAHYASEDDTVSSAQKRQQASDYDDARAIVAALRTLVTP